MYVHLYVCLCVEERGGGFVTAFNPKHLQPFALQKSYAHSTSFKYAIAQWNNHAVAFHIRFGPRANMKHSSCFLSEVKFNVGLKELLAARMRYFVSLWLKPDALCRGACLLMHDNRCKVRKCPFPSKSNAGARRGINTYFTL